MVANIQKDGARGLPLSPDLAITNKGWALKKTAIPILLALVGLTSTAAKSTKFVFTWINPAFTPTHFSKIMVRGKVENRAEFEDQLAAAIARPGTEAIASYALLPKPSRRPSIWLNCGT